VTALDELSSQLEDERTALGRELNEIELLLQQARTEAERHEQRRAQLAERLTKLEAGRTDPAELQEVRQQLHAQTRRAALMESQQQILEGKQRTLRRFEERLRQALSQLEGVAITKPAGTAAAPQADARAVLAAQEHMRREIARQMHDGPAQSIANIALQAELVQRLMRRSPSQAEEELAGLQTMVQHALEATKRFIFEVRPMVLDDLGIVPTLRRSAHERSQRSGIPIRFESAGADRRLEPELESNLFRIVDEALSAFVDARPDELFLRLNWTEDALETTVQGRLTEGPAEAGRTGDASAGEELPPALAAMITEQQTRQAATETARRRSRGLPIETWDAIRTRAESIGMSAALEEGGSLLRVRALVPAR
jgi:two-component system, NarL family, sensor histidine kinase DegS